MENLQSSSVEAFIFPFLDAYPIFPMFNEDIRKEFMSSVISQQPDWIKLSLHFDFVDSVGQDSDELIFAMVNMPDVFPSSRYGQLPERLKNDDFDTNHKFFVYRRGRLYSSDDIESLGFNADTITDFILSEYDNYIC